MPVSPPRWCKPATPSRRKPKSRPCGEQPTAAPRGRTCESVEGGTKQNGPEGPLCEGDLGEVVRMRYRSLAGAGTSLERGNAKGRLFGAPSVFVGGGSTVRGRRRCSGRFRRRVGRDRRSRS